MASQNTDLFDFSCMPRGVGGLLTGLPSKVCLWAIAARSRSATLLLPPLHAFHGELLGESMDEQAKQLHTERMQAKNAEVTAAIAHAQTERGLVVLLTGPGKGKSTSAFGMLYRALGHGHRVGVVQFIKGTHASGEVTFLQQLGFLGQGSLAQVDYCAMATGFTWTRGDWDADKLAADWAWAQAERMLSDASLRLVVLDELTFMLHYGYLEMAQVVRAIQQRPESQHVVITGRAAQQELISLADTVSEIGNTKHAFQAGVKAQAGVDF